MKKEKKNNKVKVVKQMLLRAETAIDHEFYLEALMIQSQIIESRLRTFITRSQNENPGLSYNLDKCLRRMRFLMTQKKDPFLLSHVDIHMLDEIRKWKNQKHHILTDIQEGKVTRLRLKRVSTEGMRLVQGMNDSYKTFKKEWKKNLLKPGEPVEKA